MESQVISTFTQHSAAFFKDRSDYDSVTVLLLYWRDGDLEVDEELKAVRKLFGASLNFVVASYPIPGDGTQQARLYRQIASVVEESALQPRSLLILYYTGHCRETEGKAEWAARRRGGSTLIWSDIQRCCFGAIGDVLLILDCCHATLFAKGRKDCGRFEILAACAKGLESPLPGLGSFTWALLKALSEERLRDGIAVRKLRGLIEDYSRETPFWDSFGSDSVATIIIKRLKPSSHVGFAKKPAGYVFFRASLVDDLDGLQISDWLKTNAPENVSAIHIEAVVSKARRLQRNLDHGAFAPTSILRKLSTTAQSEILRELQSLDTVMANSRQAASDTKKRDNSRADKDVFEAMQSTIDEVSNLIETPILLDLSEENIDRAVKDDDAVPQDIIENISLRNQIMASDEDPRTSYEIPRQDIEFEDNLNRFNYGRIGEQNVLLEFFGYETDQNGDLFPETVQQLNLMAARLCHSKRLSFHILPCLGYVEDKVECRFGLVYQLPPLLSAARLWVISLHSLFTTIHRVSLSQRMKTAYAIITALENFHRIGWIHKAIRSDNVCFLVKDNSLEAVDNRKGDGGDVDFSSPWLIGFEYARAGAAGSKLEEDYSEVRNLYRHPDRWGRPAAKHTRAHDIYSLGVVLMEIGFWKAIDQVVAPPKPGQRRVAAAFRESLMRRLERALPHQTGDVFVAAVKACFDYEGEVVGKSEFEMQQILQRTVLAQVKKIVNKV